jgi:ribosomal protein S18 acetylase RimI-like enzyme
LQARPFSAPAQSARPAQTFAKGTGSVGELARTAEQARAGRDVIVRRLRRDEADEFFAHLLRLDPDARRRRFGAVVSECFLRDYANRPPKPGTVIEGAFVDGVLRGVGELRPVDDAGTAAEVAFSVEAGFRGMGLGARLMDRLLLIGSNHGVRLVTMVCMADNTAMKRLFRRHGGKLVVSDGMADGTIRTAWPTPFSLAREALAEGEGAADTVLGGLARPKRRPVRDSAPADPGRG